MYNLWIIQFCEYNYLYINTIYTSMYDCNNNQHNNKTKQRYFSVSPANNANEMNNFFKTKIKPKCCFDIGLCGLGVWSRDCSSISSWLFANLIHHAHELLFCNPHAFPGASAGGMEIPARSANGRRPVKVKGAKHGLQIQAARVINHFFLFFYTVDIQYAVYGT